MVNLSNLKNIEPINLSVDLTNPDILNTATTSANDITGGYFGLGVGIVIYIWLMYISTTENSPFGFDFLKGSVFSSAISIIITLIMLGLDLISSFIHLMWFVLIFLLSLIGSYILKDKE